MTEIHIVNRAGGGSREAFAPTTVTFGRDAANVLIVDGKHTSRRHGELRYEDGHWLIVNVSPNGTELNGRRITAKPRQLQDRDVIAIAGEIVFEVRIDEAPAAAVAADEQSEPSQAMSKRTRLWLFIGIYLVLFFGLFFFLSTLKQKNRDQQQDIRLLTHGQIEDEIRKPLTNITQDARQGVVELEIARELIDRLDSTPDAAYRCYRAYKKSLALAGLPHFEPGTDQLHYEQVRNRLIDDVSATYATAYEKLKSQEFRQATEAFRRLTRIYPDPASTIHKNARRNQSIASKKLGKRKRWR